MPCDTVQMSTVKFNASTTDLALLAKAMKTLGFTVSANGKTFYRGQEKAGFIKDQLVFRVVAGTDETQLLNQLKRAYSAEVVRATSVRFGWAVRENEDLNFEVNRR